MTAIPGINASNVIYDLTNVSTSNNIYEFAKYTNDLTGQVFFMGVLLIGFIILFVSMKRYGNQEAFLSTSFVITILGVGFAALDFIPSYFLVILVLIFGMTFTGFFLRKNY